MVESPARELLGDRPGELKFIAGGIAGGALDGLPQIPGRQALPQKTLPCRSSSFVELSLHTK